ncbi:MAG: hypothetical protein COU25_03930 [Candidatus Levybacteria bacterium CG10_big_fil_rev_8_21_14_0_10_35_13]|nr:MAG: hypothetical protein COU25_03930 [Candidatus Levybacteria bacterium CG10_big_fil_rev_8_21_14_0_10_35_13]
MKIDGKKISEDILNNLKERVGKLKKKRVTPHLYIITFGKNPQTESYLKQKLLKAGQIGAKITIKRFLENSEENKILKLIETLNNDKEIHGIIVQRPLPKNFDNERISLAIIPLKDVDGFHPHSYFQSPVGLAVIKLIESTIPNQDIHSFLKSKKIVLIGKGITAGKPIINLFRKLKIKTKVIDSKTRNKQKILKSADIIVSSVGKKIITKDMIKKGVLLIGVGMHIADGKLKGDYNEDEIRSKAVFYSPTPGGIGPVNVTMLMKNLIESAEK